ncbi:30S ribosomal protein S1 [Pseudobacteriovorax antillogorgiicola]|uniref:Small ribosomal subunit protein bS1 n=1 Tax=Pseudobacteriovorax antillogorgiicola TaxID=1513793 RepID=A0A1Y6BYF8_9BACT|nr:30S ribosomal protein S1 [Pseudobacteriovorax antillogorgiicola]TCS50330.1 SSU ribosomal protein S1P [Pseudobacteriovorax antillogorgiicola]SMF34532.1 SSU ribosomal protein S1P [Pseudobacteriovorax antillogorgiicola]
MELQESKLAGIGTIQWEDEDTGFENESDLSQEFANLLDQEEATNTIKEGSIVNGTVVRFTEDTVIVDIGHKSEGEIPKGEFKAADGELSVKEGDTVEVYLDSFEDNDGEMVLSRERAEMLRAWDRISDAYENNEIVEGTVVARVKGGLSVDIGVKAFLPGSQVDLRPVRNLDKLIGTQLSFKIIKFNKKRGNIVLSRRVLLEQDREKLRSETLSNLKEGAELKGIVKNITDYGAFIDLGGIDGLLHITDMSWGRINHPSQMFEVGQEIEVKVLSYDEGRQRVSLGYKQLQTDPWLTVAERYNVDSRAKGTVVSLTDYGAFVEMEQGVEGLIHISEMSWSKRIKHPSKVVQVGDEVEVVILAMDIENRRISLGMKQIEPNPWEVVKEKYQEGDIIAGKIRNITDFGIFVGIEDGIDGLIHISDISWTDRINHPADKFKKGDEVEAKILQIDAENERFSLGIKQLSEDPWAKAAVDMPAGTKGTGRVTKVTDFGAFVEISEGIEGMIHISELSEDNVERVEDAVKEGDEIDFVVLATDSEERRFSLSRKALIKQLEGEELNNYINQVAEPKTGLADAFAKAKAAAEEKDGE